MRATQGLATLRLPGVRLALVLLPFAFLLFGTHCEDVSEVIQEPWILIVQATSVR